MLNVPSKKGVEIFQVFASKNKPLVACLECAASIKNGCGLNDLLLREIYGRCVGNIRAQVGVTQRADLNVASIQSLQ